MKDKFIQMIEGFKQKVILVIGDVGLDKYIYGSVERISPEAPVPIIHAKSEKVMPGLAGNAASNIASLGALVYLISVTGADSMSEILRRELEALGIKSHLIQDANRNTIYKTRIIGNKQQIARVDYETVEHINEEVEKKILDEARFLIKGVDAVVISDYGKGVVTRELASKVITLCQEHGKKVIVDPRPQHKEFYKGAFLITPNDKESFEMCPVQDVTERGKRLTEELDGNILITLGERGMILFEKNKVGKEIVELPTQAREVYDVSGAGDTVVATLALALGSGASLHEAAILANHAAGIVVAKIGTAQIKEKELIAAFREEEKKIKTIEELKEIVSELKQKGKQIVTTNGIFDLVHYGHILSLREAKKFGDVLILGLNSDASTRRLKGEKRPLISERERAALMASLDCVDYVCIFDEDTPTEFLGAIKPHIHTKGSDRTMEEIAERNVVEKNGGKVMLFPIIEGFSTTGLISKILERYDEEQAQEFGE